MKAALKDASDVQTAHGPEAVIKLLNGATPIEAADAPREKRIRFFKPSEIRSYEPNTEAMLVGNCHIIRGEVFVIGGEPGVGKSTAATELAFCGATGRDWLGLPVRRKFRTMILQTENGRYRLRQEYIARPDHEVNAAEDWIYVCEPPPYGLTLGNSEFQEDTKAALEAFRPDVVILDPWNAAAQDDKQKDYAEAFSAIRALLPKGENRPALGIVAHTRKPKSDEKRTGGTALMHLLAGSYMLASVPRSVFIMVPGSADEIDNAVCWFNPKNSNGEKCGRSAWERSPSGFEAIRDFDWETFDDPGEKRRVVTEAHIRTALGDNELQKPQAVKALMDTTGLGKRACEKALAENGKFSAILTFDAKGFIGVANE